MLTGNVNRALAGLQGKALVIRKWLLSPTLRLHNDGAARRVSAGLNLAFTRRVDFLQADLLGVPFASPR